MIYITQLIYIHEGEETTFNEFENIAIPTIYKYNGQLLLRIKPNQDDFIESNIAQPFEIHLVAFDTQQDFDNFKLDEERRKFLHLRDKAIKTTIMIQGEKI